MRTPLLSVPRARSKLDSAFRPKVVTMMLRVGASTVTTFVCIMAPLHLSPRHLQFAAIVLSRSLYYMEVYRRHTRGMPAYRAISGPGRHYLGSILAFDPPTILDSTMPMLSWMAPCRRHTGLSICQSVVLDGTIPEAYQPIDFTAVLDGMHDPFCRPCKVVIQGLRSGCHSFFSTDPSPFIHAEPGGGGHAILHFVFHWALQTGLRRSEVDHQIVCLQEGLLTSCILPFLWTLQSGMTSK